MEEFKGKVMGITGIAGFVGMAMAERAMEKGMKVKGMEASASALEEALPLLRSLPSASSLFLGVFEGDITSPAAARRLCEGADVIFHTAAIVTEGGEMEECRRVNVGGTAIMAQAAREAAVSRFVHLSSVMVYGFTFPPHVGEDGPLRGEGNPYCQTKIESEQAALEQHEKGKMEVIIVRPGDIYGPRCRPWVLRPLQLMRKGLFVIPNGGRGCMNHLHISNLLDGVFLALACPAAGGEAFNLTDGGSTTWMGYFALLAHQARLPRPRAAPFWLLLLLFRLLEFLAWLFRLRLPLAASGLYFISRPHPYSIEKARRLLGYEPKVTLEQGMLEIRSYLQKNSF